VSKRLTITVERKKTKEKRKKEKKKNRTTKASSVWSFVFSVALSL
jgi:hypothetical protein